MIPVRIAITGAGAVSPLGEGWPALAEGALAGQSGIGRARQFVGTVFEERVAGAIDRAPGLEHRADAANEFARRAALEALADAGITLPSAQTSLSAASGALFGAPRIALVLGSTIAPRDRNVDAIAAILAARIGLAGSLVVVVETACTSGSAAVALGALMLRAGYADVALAGGADELDLKSFAGFAALGLLAPGGCTPFGPLVGTTLGEGAAFFVLEREPDAVGRGARVRAILEGDGSSADAFHPTSPHPSGDGLLRAMTSALADAGCAPDGIDLVSAHGTGTRANDAAEVAAIHALFGARGATVPVTATKSQVGHGLGAAGAIELAVALAAMERGVVPPTLGAADRRAGCDLAVSAEPRAANVARVLKLGAAFGGANAALVVARPDVALPACERPRRRVYLAAMGGFGGAEAHVDPMGTLADFDAEAPAGDVERLVPGVNPRGLDGVSRALVVAVARAVDAFVGGRSAGGAEPTAISLDRTGLYVGQRRASPKSVAEFDDAVEARGYLHVPAGPFTRRVLNTATGAASRARALRGPTLTISTGRGSGLAALVLAAEHLASKADADHIVVASVDEGGGDDGARGDGAAAVVLTTEPCGVEVAEWGVGPPLPQRSEVHAPSVAGLLEVGRAVAALRAGRSRSETVEEPGALATARIVLALLAVVAVALTGCQSVMWYGQDASHAVPIRVLSRCGEQFVVAGGAEQRSFDAIGLETLSVARGGRVAYAAEDDGAWWVVVDGHVMPAGFDRVALMEWSPVAGTLAAVVGDADGDHLLAVTRDDRVMRWSLGPGFAAIAKGSLVTNAGGAFAFVGFDAAGAHVARGELLGAGGVAAPGGAARDVDVGPGFDGIASLSIAPDGSPSYIARRLNDVFVVRGGIESGPYEDVAALDVSPDGARGVALIRDEVAGEPAWRADDGAWSSEGYDRIGDVRIAPGTRAVAMRAKRGEEEYVVTESGRGEETFGPYRAVVPKTLAIGGPDDRVAFAMTDDAGAHVVDRGIVGPPWTSVDAVAVAEDGRLGFIAHDGATALVFVEGEALGSWQRASELHLTPNGSVFVAHAKGRDAVVENGEARWFDQIMEDTLTFGADRATWGAVAVVPEGLTLARASGLGPPIDLEAYFGEMIRTRVVDWEPALLRRWVAEALDAAP